MHAFLLHACKYLRERGVNVVGRGLLVFFMYLYALYLYASLSQNTLQLKRTGDIAELEMFIAAHDLTAVLRLFGI